MVVHDSRTTFAKPERISGVLMMCSLILAITISNSMFCESYVNFIFSPLIFKYNEFTFQSSLIHLVNDGLMTFFFLMIGLELKYHLILGESRNPQSLVLPVTAAIGGIVVPAFIYLYFNWNTPTIHGWAIPIATDTAFMLGALSFFSKYIPAKLRTFILAFSLIDDILALAILAIFYTKSLNSIALLMSVSLFLILVILNKSKVDKSIYYLFVGFFLWMAMVNAGIHGTLVGVILASTIPVIAHGRFNPSFHKLENILRPLVYYFILPAFIFVNSGIRFDSCFQELLFSNVSIGIILGLLLGKPLGIASFSYCAIKMNWCTLPYGVHWDKFFAIAILGGIGFTLSLFIGDLTFETGGEPHYAMRVGIIVASLLATFFGLCLFGYAIKHKK